MPKNNSEQKEKPVFCQYTTAGKKAEQTWKEVERALFQQETGAVDHRAVKAVEQAEMENREIVGAIRNMGREWL